MAPIRQWTLCRDASEDQKAQLEHSTPHEAVGAISDDLTAYNTYVDATTRLAEFAGSALVVTGEIGRAHVCTPVTLIYLVCRLLLEKKKQY